MKCTDTDVLNFCYGTNARTYPEAWTVMPDWQLMAEHVPAGDLARVARRICMLYVADYSCLPVKLPDKFFKQPSEKPCELRPEFA